MKEIDRQLIELAVAAGRSSQSELTRFLHSESREVIPVYENTLFILALMRTRRMEQIQEAKQLLEKVLAYQDKEGNFPVYLHEHPCCPSRSQGIKLLAPLYWIYEKFHHVLGKDLKANLSHAMGGLLCYSLGFLSEKKNDYLTTLRIGCAALAFGKKIDDSELASRGAAIVDELNLLGSHSLWFTRHGIAEIFVSLQMLYPKISESPWADFWKHAQQTWNPKLLDYSGPVFSEKIVNSEFASSLYDLYIASFSTILPKKCLTPASYQLQAALIQRSEEPWDVPSSAEMEGTLEGVRWKQYRDERVQFSLIEQHQKSQSKALYPLSIFWESHGTPCALVCQGGEFNKLQFQSDSRSMELLCFFNEAGIIEQPFENRELLLYCSANPQCKVTVEGMPATTFRLDERVFIQSESNFELSFTLEEGSADFVGHVMPIKKEDGVERQIFLRAIRKTSPCVVRVSIKRI